MVDEKATMTTGSSPIDNDGSAAEGTEVVAPQPNATSRPGEHGCGGGGGGSSQGETLTDTTAATAASRTHTPEPEPGPQITSGTAGTAPSQPAPPTPSDNASLLLEKENEQLKEQIARMQREIEELRHSNIIIENDERDQTNGTHSPQHAAVAQGGGPTMGIAKIGTALGRIPGIGKRNQRYESLAGESPEKEQEMKMMNRRHHAAAAHDHDHDVDVEAGHGHAKRYARKSGAARSNSSSASPTAGAIGSLVSSACCTGKSGGADGNKGRKAKLSDTEENDEDEDDNGNIIGENETFADHDLNLAAAASADIGNGVDGDTPFKDVVKDRAGWLVGLLVLQSCSSFILARNEALLESHLVIVQFLTMLVGAGGNAGNQASVRVIRGLAVGTLNERTLKPFLWTEAKMGVALSAILGLAGLIRASVFMVPVAETVAITTSLYMIVISSVCIGALLPLAMHKCGLDPAHSSTTIQVLMDILGVTVTVWVSGLILNTGIGPAITSLFHPHGDVDEDVDADNMMADVLDGAE